jgi:hypothetical protein
MPQPSERDVRKRNGTSDVLRIAGKSRSRQDSPTSRTMQSAPCAFSGATAPREAGRHVMAGRLQQLFQHLEKARIVLRHEAFHGREDQRNLMVSGNSMDSLLLALTAPRMV